MARSCLSEPATIVGTNGDDLLIGTAGVDVIVGLGGDDEIHGLAGDDIICGNVGNDIIRGNAGDDKIHGDGGDDTLYGNLDADVIVGGNGNDVIYSSSGSERLERRDRSGSTLSGGAGNDVIFGSNKADKLFGGDGADRLIGYQGNDRLLGGAGPDILGAGTGIDILNGGAGSDLLRLTNGDRARGGFGADACMIDSGQPALAIGCTLTRQSTEPSERPVSFTFSDSSGAIWDGELFGFIQAGTRRFVGESATCYLVLAEITPTRVADGSRISSGFDAPEFGVVAGGVFIDDSSGCDTTTAEDAGFRSVFEAEAPVGTPIAVYSEVLVPASNGGPVSSVIVGDPRFDEDFERFDPVELASFPEL